MVGSRTGLPWRLGEDTAPAYALAVAIAAAAVLLRSVLSDLITGAQFITFFPAVVLSAYLCGRRAGLLTTVLCGLAGWYRFVTPLFSFRIEQPAEAVTLVMYLLTSATIAALIGPARAAFRRERAAAGALRVSEEQFRLLADSSPALIWVTDHNAQVTFANRRYEEVFGRPADDIEGEGWRRIVHPDDVDAFNARFLAALAGRTRFRGEVRVHDRDGRLLWLHCEGVPRFGADGAFLGYVGANLDITDVKRAEARLREANETLEARVAERTADLVESQRRFRGIFDSAFQFMALLAPDGTVMEVNRTALHWSEVEPGAIVGKPFWLAAPMRDDPALQAAIEAGVRRAATGETVREEHVMRGAGEVRAAIDFSLKPVPGEDGEVVWLVAEGRDITELKEVQDALRQSQKLESMGQLTGGVAHDVNNLLTPITGALDLLQRRGVGGDRERRLIDGALQSAERAKTLVQRLLAFARRQPLRTEAVDVARIVDDMAGLIASTTGPQVRVVVDVAPDLPPAAADANQLEMALLNLSVNARDAMPDGGTLRISADEEQAGTGHRAPLTPGRYVRLSVADTGVGMDEATRARAIEPFFSTKGIGKGTGLGLSMAHGLAAQLGGALTIASTPGLGTNVELWLPVAGEAAKPANQAARADRAEGYGTVLLVDDEDLVRTATADMLADIGYTVVETGSPHEALRLIEHGLAPDLLVTDHLMPGMTGVELARALRRRRSATPVLIVSGYAELDGIDPDLARLAKPFRRADLAESLAGLKAV